MRSIFILLLLIGINVNAQTVIDYANLSNATCVFTTATDVAVSPSNKRVIIPNSGCKNSLQKP